MQKKQFVSIIGWSTAALIIPLLGQLFLSGRSWSLGDFIFAWVFFNILGIVYTFATKNISHRGAKIAVSIIIIAIFAFIWIRLATG